MNYYDLNVKIYIKNNPWDFQKLRRIKKNSFKG